MSAPMEFPERFNMAWYFLDRNVEEGRGGQALPLLPRRGLHLPRGAGRGRTASATRCAGWAWTSRTASCWSCPTGRSSRSPGSARPRWARSSPWSTRMLPAEDFVHYFEYSRARVAVVDESTLDRIEPLRDALPAPAPPGRGGRAGPPPLVRRRSAREASDRARERGHPPRRPRHLALHQRLHRQAQGGRPPAAGPALEHRALREAGAGHPRGRPHGLGAQALLRLRHGHQPAVPVRGGRRHRALQRAQRAGHAVRRDRALPAHHPHLRAHHDQRHAEPPRRGRSATCRPCASCSPRGRRCRPSCTAAGRRRSAWRSWTASARRRCSTSTSRTTPATWCRAAWAGWCPATRPASWTPTGTDVPDGEAGTLWIKGESAAILYWQAHEKSKEVLRGDWVVTGDHMRRDAERLLLVRGPHRRHAEGGRHLREPATRWRTACCSTRRWRSAP